jgi:hypothetical protein
LIHLGDVAHKSKYGSLTGRKASKMPLYYFDSADGSRETDTEGTELPDVSSARKHAVIVAGQALRDHPIYLWEGGEFRIEVFNEKRLHLFSVISFTLESPAIKAL